MPAPETVTDAIDWLRSQGYHDDFDLQADGLRSAIESSPHPYEAAVVDHTFRFEGPSDPGDEAIVLGISCPSWDRKGVVISAFGPDADPEHARLLRTLTANERPAP